MKHNLILAALFAAAPVMAGTPAPKTVADVAPTRSISYSNASVSWLHTELDDVGGDSADGVGAAIEFALNSSLYATAAGWWQSEDYVGGDIDGVGAQIGLGAHFPLCKEADIVVEVGANYEDYDTDDDFGVYVSPHFRFLLGPIEAHAGAYYTTAFDSDWVGFVDLFIPIVNNLDLAVGAHLGDDYWGFNVGARVRF